MCHSSLHTTTCSSIQENDPFEQLAEQVKRAMVAHSQDGGTRRTLLLSNTPSPSSQSAASSKYDIRAGISCSSNTRGAPQSSQGFTLGCSFAGHSSWHPNLEQNSFHSLFRTFSTPNRRFLKQVRSVSFQRGRIHLSKAKYQWTTKPAFPKQHIAQCHAQRYQAGLLPGQETANTGWAKGHTPRPGAGSAEYASSLTRLHRRPYSILRTC
jgi:hypothetical protein